MDKDLRRYAAWLETFIKDITELQPDKIGVCALMPDGSALTGYFGDCGHQDKALMGYHLHTDAVMDTVTANASRIVEAANQEEEGGDSDGD